MESFPLKSMQSLDKFDFGALGVEGGAEGDFSI